MSKSPSSRIKIKESRRKEKKEQKVIFQAPRGMHDILPDEQPWWNRVRRTLEEVADFYGFSRIDTPLLEEAAVFERGVGGATDIVEKQMYVLRTKGGDRLALRPENTAGIIRAYLEHGLSRLGQPVKLYYLGPFFRYERPQAGRYRQFHQAGFEIIGDTDNPLYDAQIILATLRFLRELKIKNLIVQLNSIGCKNCRGAYKKKLVYYYRGFEKKICKDCRRRLSVNPLRLLDCKNESCEEIKKDAPAMLDNLCSSCRAHFKSVLEYLDDVGLPYTLNNFLVRGLDYYLRTVFEILPEQNPGFALGGGGRYDLGEMLADRCTPLPAVGSAPGVERIIEMMKAQGIAGLTKPKPKIFLIQMGAEARKKSLSLLEKFADVNLRVAESLGKDSLKAQMRAADKEGAELSLILGQREVFENTIIIRDMKSGTQETVPWDKAVEVAKKTLNNLNQVVKKTI